MTESVLAKPRGRSAVALLEEVRPFERIILAFFVYLALLAWVRALPVFPRLGLTLLPFALVTAWRAATAVGRPWANVLREWLGLGLILVAYWSIELFAAAPRAAWPSTWIHWDRRLLDGAGFRAAMEVAGPVIPALLETAYLLLYSLPPLSLGLVYLAGNRAGRERFLQVLFLATLTTYAMLPLWPTASPRMAFPGVDEPHYTSFARAINVWVSDHLDITTGVFPSGHVTVGFACAFGLFAARLRRRSWPWLILGVAALVALATIYGRYHYAVDAVAGIAVAAGAAQAAARWNNTEF